MLATQDDQTAIESTKAFACAIDMTAYWSEGSDARKDELAKCLLDIEELSKNKDHTPVFCKSIFQKKDCTWFAASCDEEKTEPAGTVAEYPYGSAAIRARMGGIASKLAEWSGGGNKITGNAVGNRITGMTTAGAACDLNTPSS